MIESITYRLARAEDARIIAELFRISSDGVADYVWTTLQADYPGLSLLDIGERRYAREDTDFSYQNCVVAESGGAVVGMLHSFAMADELEPPGADSDPVLRPYGELELPASLYISGVALRPEFRNRGIGTEFLRMAHDRAREKGLARLSLLAFEQNAGAVRLYTRQGFEVADRRTIVPHPLIHHTGDVLLMAAHTQ